MRNISIEIKVIIYIILFTLFIVSLERYKLSKNITNQFIESKKSKNKLLSDTIAPIVSLNLFLGLNDANTNYLNQIVKQNSDLNLLELLDINGNTIYSSSVKDKTILNNDKDDMHFFAKDILDTLTSNKSATLELHFLNKKYQLFLEKNRTTTIELFSITFVLLILFVFIIKREFRHLKKLTTNVRLYDPKINNTVLDKTDRIDEVGIIHNAIVSMEERITSHTQLLDETNLLLEEKVKIRTKELDELNKSLTHRIELVVKDLENKNKLMLQQSRLAQMGEMISMIAHQWRQPLGSISAVVINLSMKSQLDEYEEKYFIKKFQDIMEYTNHLSSTIHDFRDFFAPTNKKEEIEYKQIVDESLKIIESSLKEKSIQISKRIESNHKYFTYNSELKQVVINLIINAKDALLENSIEKPKITIETLVVNGAEILRVRDNGGGISDDVIDKIFDPYFSTKESRNGTGLGLYMSKIIIQEHCSGKLKAYNSEEGAVFEISLPFNNEGTKTNTI